MAKSGQSSKSPKYIRLIISTIHLSGVLDIVTVLIKSAFGETTLSPWPDVPSALQAYLAALIVSTRRMPMKIQQSKRPGPPTALRRAPPSRAEGG